MTTSSDRPPVDDAGIEQLTVLGFLLEGERYCVRLAAADSVVGVAAPDALEGAADPWNAGAVSIDGTEIRVVDLPRVVASASRSVSRPAEAALLVLDESIGEGTRYGWLVDDVGDTRTIWPDELEATRTSARIVRGRIDLGDDGGLLLDERAIHG